MNETYINCNTSNFQNVCRLCLGTNDVRPMSPHETDWYQTVIAKLCQRTLESEWSVCCMCGHLLHKYIRFHGSCQRADLFLSAAHQEIKSGANLQQHNFTTTNPKVYSIGPENNLDLEFNTKPDENFDLVLEENNFEDVLVNAGSDVGTFSDNEDDVPLVMLSSSDSGRKRHKVKRKKKKLKAIEEPTIDTTEIKQEIKLKEEPAEDTENDKSERRRRGAVKGVRAGFSSRMVQETEEYIVIKLTEEQVRGELQARAASEQYVRSPFKCASCVRGFNFPDVLAAHLDKHKPERGSFQCKLCSQYCASAVSLRGHVKSHTTRYQCRVCRCVRVSRQHLLEHHALAHGRPRDYRCQLCVFTTNKRTVIQRHVRSHRASEGDRLTCEQCGRRFNSVEALRVHTARHDRSQSVVCPECPRRFIYAALLARHVAAVHTRRDYYCVECDTSFRSQDNLRLHFKKAKRHRDSSSYTHSCAQCPSSFVCASSLAAHEAAAHGGGRPHGCAHCDRRYSSRDSLRAHTRRCHKDHGRHTDNKHL